MIGVLTAVIGDLASSFGCTIGLKDAVTAISFVALGTSVPGKSGPKDAVTAVCFVARGFPGKSGLEDTVTAVTFVELALSACVPR